MQPSKVLLVEDSPVVRLTITQALKADTPPVPSIFEADTAGKAIELFNREHPDLVFVDINLPVGAPVRGGGETFFGFLASASPADGGVEAARYMLGHNPGLKLIVCTGNPPDDPRVRDLVRSGAFDVIQKPVRAAQIRDVMGRVRAEG